MRHIRIAVGALLGCAMVLIGQHVVRACTAFCAVGPGQVLVGNNEDWHNPRTKIWFLPAKPGSYGRVYVGFDDLRPQGGMNERGLWFDGFAAPPMNDKGSSDLPHFPGDIIDTAMAECSTVEEVVRLFSRYNRAFLAEAILMFADASGDAVSIERNAMVRKSRRHFVQTNFHQSRSLSGRGDGRFTIASDILESAGEGISVDLFRRILAATHQKGSFPTLYSNIYELRSQTMHLYHFQDFEHVVTFRLADELKKGERVLDIPALFPRNVAAEAFAARQKEAGPAARRALAIALFALPVILIAIAVFGWIRGGRQFRVALSVLVGAIAMVVVSIALTLPPCTSSTRPEIVPVVVCAAAPAAIASTAITASTIRTRITRPSTRFVPAKPGRTDSLTCRSRTEETWGAIATPILVQAFGDRRQRNESWEELLVFRYGRSTTSC